MFELQKRANISDACAKFEIFILQKKKDKGKRIAPSIKYAYPASESNDPFTKSVMQFCFPDVSSFPIEEMDPFVFYLFFIN